MFDYDAEVRLYREHFRGAWGVQPDDRVLDVGCGGGQTTRDAAEGAARVLGVDISEPMLEHARSQPLPNVSYLLADAATHDFEPESFDLAISRFGVMFFDDLVGAFGNIRRALRPEGRLVVLVWQSRTENEWAQVIPEAIGGSFRDDSPFALGDPAVTRDILTEAGYADPTFTAVRELLYYGPDSEAAYDNVLRLREPQALLADLEPAAADRAHASLRATLDAHDTGSGIQFESSAWIVSTQRA
ncbi:class I SAM-dependent methyltransferase [Kribbella kalugense]|uniref:Ubiquinone/menaquinone biosynthesis C-methylase UbiE n=1 Tax=Kribbella kalugense TaxID=2512221 RepID=A0A4R7ZXY6_9ACTN|nr:class I SAM-dependent methyltransferase [Kribbella kalugense]TDW22586.1 ubiquinone/menaquinone biosynthesis C-methylase UbiE [Kribbella kalugense]